MQGQVLRGAQDLTLHRCQNRSFTLRATPPSHAGGCVTAATTTPITVTINGCVVFPNVVAVFSTATTAAGNFSTADGDATIAPAIAIAVATTFVILL